MPPDIPVDLALVAVPREQVAAVLHTCAKAQVSMAVVFTSGFSEADVRGRVLEAELAAIGRETGLRILGPNAYGFINFVDRVPATPAITLRRGDMVAGPVGLVAHSGGMATGSIYARASAHGIRFSYIVCPGNEVDLELCDVLDFLVEDDTTRVIAAEIEGVRDGRRFLAAIEAARKRGKPVVVLKIGRSKLGQELALSHTGHLAGADEVFQAACDRYGVIRVDDYDELYLTAGLLAGVTDAHRARLARRAQLAVVSISGGIASITGDLAGVRGLTMAPLAPPSAAALALLLPEFQAPTNPLDVGAVALTQPGVVDQALDILAADPGVDVVIPALTVAENYDSVLEAIASRSSRDRLLTVLWAGSAFGGRGAEILQEAGVAYFDAPRDLIGALDRLVRHCRVWAAITEESSATERRVVLPGAQALAENRWLMDARSARRSMLSEWESKAFLGELGVPVPVGELVRSEAAAVAAAERIGHPVVLKLVSSKIPHKSEHGAVALRLGSADAVAAAFRRQTAMTGQLGGPEEGVLVEEMVRASVEAVVGVRVDPHFGPVVMLGWGGVLVELVRETVFLLPPLTPSAVRRAIDRLPVLSALLAGYRGSEPADRDAFEALLLHIGDIAVPLSSVVDELEMNPVLVSTKGGGVTAVDALVRLAAR